ncbi:MAG: AMP-binding protein, partial [Mycobacterium sp.]
MAVALNIADLAEHAIDAVPDRVALICGDEKLTYAELEEKANRLAHYLIDRGVKKDDKVANVLPDTPGVKTALVVEDGSDNDFQPYGGVSFYEAIAQGAPERDFGELLGERSADDIYILYTGGTTGFPKGVMWRHEDIYRV